MSGDVVIEKAFKEARDLTRWVVQARPMKPATPLQRVADEGEAVLGNAVAALASLVVMVYAAVIAWTVLNAWSNDLLRRIFDGLPFNMVLIAVASVILGILLAMKWMLRLAAWAKSYRLPQIVSLSATVIVLGRALVSAFTASDPLSELGAAFLRLFGG